VPLADAIQATGVPGLWVLGAEAAPNGPSELFASAEFATLVGDLRDAYDAVVISSPALLETADSAELARRADGVLLAVRIARTERSDVQRASDLLAGVGAHVVGVVVDGCEDQDA
jgi:Mrp family chromosome partitioning ATPase